MIVNVKEIPKYIQPQQRLLGLDLGEKTIGLSLSAPFISGSFMCIASPLKTLPRTKFTHDIQALKDIFHAYRVGGLIFGWPLHLNGNLSKRCQSTNQFALNLSYKGINIPTAFFDERMSTRHVETFLNQSTNISRQKRKNIVDKIAATFILRGALEYLKHNEEKMEQKEADV